MKDKGIRGIVHGLLINDPRTRNSDKRLYVEVCRQTNPELMSEPFETAYMKLPSTETVRRSREDIQMRNPELKPNDDVEAFRELKEEEYREFYGSRCHS